MKKNSSRLLVLLIILGLSGFFLIELPSVQDRLLDREITRRMSDVPEDLFADDALRVTLCGSASPLPDSIRAAPCVMVIADGRFYIVDTGNRSTNNLGLWRIPSRRVGAVLLTHFHSDHIGDLGEFNMMTWAQGRPGPLTVYGPKGVGQVVEGFSSAYALDTKYRIDHHGPDYLDPVKGRMISKEFDLDGGPVTVLKRGELRITMFAVDHSPITPAAGYRFDYKDRSVVISGDTVKTDAVIAAAKGADVLFHEALARHVVKRMESAADTAGNNQIRKIMNDIQNYHTSPVEAAEVANAAGVKELVLYHLVPAPPNRVAEKIFLRGIKDVRSTGVALGYDGMTLTLPVYSDKITEQDLNDRL